MIPRRPAIDLNADAGEGCEERELFRWISSASVACGGHAGDRATMQATLALARECGVAVGAHPGYEDRERFGRVELGLPPAALAALVARQVGALAAVAAEAAVPLAHVKPHGALYHRLAADDEAARAVAAALAALDPDLAVMAPPASALLAAARAAGLATLAEGFVDRGYRADGGLVARGASGALLGGAAAVAQALALAERRPLPAAGGAALRLAVATLCLHSDTPGAAATARAVRQGLEAGGFDVECAASAARRPALPILHVVGAAIVEAERVLLTRRGPALSMPGKWEFPGGKVEAGEAPEAALAREVAEELGLAIEVGAHLGRGSALHAGRRIRLDVFLARAAAGEPALGEHDAAGWFTAAELGGLDWPEADLPILPRLAAALARQSSEPR